VQLLVCIPGRVALARITQTRRALVKVDTVYKVLRRAETCAGYRVTSDCRDGVTPASRSNFCVVQGPARLALACYAV
jgi:hypothetical protein